MSGVRKEIVDIRWSSAFGIFGLGTIVGAIFFVFQMHEIKLSSGSTEGINMEYADLIAIILTAVAVIVTALGVGIAIITFVGFQQIKKSAEEAAKVSGKHAALEEAKRQLTLDKETKKLPDPELQAHLERTIEEVTEKIVLRINGRPEGFGDESTEYGD